MQHIVDAKNKKLGRLSSHIALILQGKHRASWKSNEIGEDVVIVKNVSGVVVSGKKTEQKIYYNHAGKLGHLKENTYKDVFKKDPTWVVRHAVNLMLPKNKLRAKRMRHLKFEE